MSVKDRLTGINTNLDDLESGVDAGSREAEGIRNTAARLEQVQVNTFERAKLLGTLARQAKELQACVCDQRAALKELRTTVGRLNDELKAPNPAVRPPQADAAVRQRR